MPAPSAPEIAPAVLPDAAQAADDALSRVPPLWPLGHFVAVNPFVGLAGRPFDEACALLRRVTGAAPVQSAADYRRALRDGTIGPGDLAAAAGGEWTVARLMAALDGAEQGGQGPEIATVADMLDRELPRARWGAFIAEEISKWCAVTFDENQTTWTSPWRDGGLFHGWRTAAERDRSPEIFGLRGFRAFVGRLPGEADACIDACLGIIAPPAPALADFLHRQLATIPGWAAYLQYLVREDEMRGRANTALGELLAVRLAYDAALLDAFGGGTGLGARLRRSLRPGGGDAGDVPALVRWQAAYEHGYQLRLARALAGQPSAPRRDRPDFQAVFCIDVRSEVLRRHLEAAAPGAQTLGFAGFFGFPVSHEDGAGREAALCPVLLVPPVRTLEPLPASEAAAARVRRAEAGAWKAFQNSAASCFSFVEAAGLAFAAPAGAAGRRAAPACSRAAPAFADASPAARVGLAEGALRNMGLTRNFSRLVLFCGHGSRSANNPHASSLDCGACGGHAGDVNARLAAATLNDPEVRSGLAARGIEVPADTVFLAGLHHTGTDEVALFDTDCVPATHRRELEAMRSALAFAGARARRERAPALGLSGVPEGRLRAAMSRRLGDISEVRPEWGLANNAALVAAPRSRTAALRLDGRVFLHDYDASSDTGDQVLTLILCAPVVVASWINLQYYASRVDPVRYGGGNKVLHNVMGGFAVAEGNGGDLKAGLPLQSIHDGERFVHEPRRLSVFIEAARERIDAVLAAQPAVRRLFDNGWLHLFSLEGRACHRYRPGGWEAFA
jgi:uncharacterized protein